MEKTPKTQCSTLPPDDPQLLHVLLAFCLLPLPSHPCLLLLAFVPSFLRFFLLYCTVRTVDYSNRFVPSTVHKQQNDWPMARKCDQKIHLQNSNGQFPKSSLSFLYGSLFLKIFFFLYCTSMYCKLFKQVCAMY